MVRLEVGGGVDDEGEARGVRLREAVEGEGGDGAHDLLLRLAADAAHGHAGAQPLLDRHHPLAGALEAHRPPQLLGLAAGEARRRHRHPQQLLLEQRHAEGAGEDRLQTGVGVAHRLPPLAPLEVGVGHVAGDRPGADDRHLHHEVVEVLGAVARQRGHLRPALDLEDAGGVGAADHVVGLRVVGRQVREVDLDALVGADHGDRLLERGQHAEAEEVDLDQPEVGTVVLVPLDDCPPGHRRRLQRHHLVEPAVGDDHAARVLAEVAGEMVDLPPQALEVRDPGRARVEPDRSELGVEVARPLADLGRHVPPEAPGDAVHLLEGETERLAHLARRRARAVGADHRRHGGAVRPVAPVDVLDDLLPRLARGQVEVDVRPLAPLLGQEALEEELHPDRVDGGDGEGVADRRVGGRAAALGHDALAPAEADDVPDDEEVAREVELPDQIELAFELGLGARGERPEAAAGAVPGHPAEVRDRALPRRQGVVREAVAELVEGELELGGEGRRLRDRPPPVGVQNPHLTRRAQMALAAALEQPARAVDGGALADAGEDVGEVAVGRPRVADAAGRHQRQPQDPGELGERPVAVLLLAQAVALQLDVQPPREELAQPLELAPGGVEPAQGEALGDDPLGAARQAVEAAGVGRDLRPGGAGAALGPAARGLGEQPAEVAVAAAVAREQGEPGQRRAGRGRVGDEAERSL